MSYFGNGFENVYGEISGLSWGSSCPNGQCSRKMNFEGAQFNDFGSSGLYSTPISFMSTNSFSGGRTCGPNGCTLNNSFY